MRHAHATDDSDTDHVPRRTRAAPSEDIDLTWLYCQSAAEISGIGSSHGILVTLAQTGAVMAGAGTRGIPRCVEGISPRRAAAVDRERTMRARLALMAALTPRVPGAPPVAELGHERVLVVVYGARPPWVTALAPDARTRLGRRVALLPYTLAAARGWATEAARRAREADKGSASKRTRLLAEAAAWQAKGLLFWLTGPAIDAAALKAAREEAETMAAEAWQAWQETRAKAPRQRRQPQWARGTVERDVYEHGDDVDEASDRESGEYPTAQAPGVPWRRAV